jgi:uncharacterized protein
MPTIETARKWYPVADLVHGFDHVLRVYHLADHLAQAEGADIKIVRAAALLHDVDSSQLKERQTRRLQHHIAAAEFAEQVLSAEGWSPEGIAAVSHCIRAHRFRDDLEQPQTLEAQVLFDADKLDAIGTIGVTRAIAFATQAGSPAYAPPSTKFIETGQLEDGELHSAYHEHLFKLSKIRIRLYTPTARVIAEERHRIMEDFFNQLSAEWHGIR